MTHWLLVNSPSNFELTRERGFDVVGMKQRWRKAAMEVEAGDTVFYYLTGAMAIGGETKVTGAVYEMHDIIWPCNHPGEHYPWRMPTELVKARDKDDYLPVRQFIDHYEYARRWTPEHWTLAFQGNVHRLGEADYQLIHDLL